MNVIERFFGKDALSDIKSCEFHFKESRNKMARKLGGTVGDEFKDLCQNLLESNLQESYLVGKDALEEFIDENSDRQFLKSWLTWWDSRSCFIFSAFSPKCGPKMNLAEVVHAGWANRDNRNLSLLEVAQTDVKDSVLLKAELKAIEQGLSKPAGRGPAFHEKRARDHRRELQKAVQLGKEVGSLAAGLEVDPQSGYFPPEDKSKRGRKRTKNCNPQKKPTARSEYSDPILTEKFSTTLSQPPTLSQPLLQARGSELQLESENGQLLSQGQSSQPLSQEQNSQLLSQGQSSQLLLQAKTVNCYRKLQVVNPCRKHIPVKCYHKCKVANRCRKYRLANLCYRRSINYCACLNQRASVSVNCQGNRSYTPPQQLPRRANQPQL